LDHFDSSDWQAHAGARNAHRQIDVFWGSTQQVRVESNCGTFASLGDSEGAQAPRRQQFTTGNQLISRLKDYPLDIGEPQIIISDEVPANEKNSHSEHSGHQIPAVLQRLSACELPTFGGSEKTVGTYPPSFDERRWIEKAIRRMFFSLNAINLDTITQAFREWQLPPHTIILKQGSPIEQGPGLCVLYEGVVDVMHKQKGGSEDEKMCTYDRPGQCFCELELIYDTPKATGTQRKTHWATICARSAVILWAVDRTVLRRHLPGAVSSSVYYQHMYVPESLNGPFVEAKLASHR